MNEELAFEEIVELYIDSRNKGCSLYVDEFAEKYPQHKKELLEILPLLNELEEIGNKKTEEFNTLEIENSDYKLLRQIGIGGMGIVYEAEQLSLKRKVAVKILSSKLLNSEFQREQFENEAKIIAMLHHPNIVKILSAKYNSKTCYYAMELIDGKSLNNCSFSNLETIASIALQTANALAYAHSCHVLHRDIKPSNLLLDSLNQIHISDFGLAFVFNGEDENNKRIDLKSGTIRYMAPEKLKNGTNTFLTDQYSFGVTFYEIIKKTPFVEADNTENLINKIIKGDLPKLELDSDFSAIINKCISFEPQNRYANMSEVSDDLRRFLIKEPVKARKYSFFENLILWKKRNPIASISSFIASICAIAFICSLLTGYYQTKTALSLARNNIDLADSTFSSIFEYIKDKAPSESGSRMLKELIPYFTEISKQKNISKEKITQAKKIIAEYALRADDYNLAEKTFDKLYELTNNIFYLNKKADSLEFIGKKQEANSIRNTIIKNYENSINPNEKYEAAYACMALPKESEKDYQALKIIKSLLKNDLNNQKYIFLYAKILGKNPRQFMNERIAGLEPNPIVLLRNLS